MIVKVEIVTWMELREMVWSGARDVVLEIENQGREEEALDILEKLLFMGLGVRALTQGTIAVPAVDGLINKYMG